MDPSDREIEAARRVAATLAPHLRQAQAAIAASQNDAVKRVAAQVISPGYQRWLKNMNEVVAPALRLNYSTLFPKLELMQAPVANQMLPAIELIQHNQRDQFAQLLATVRRAFESSLPPNWPTDGALIPAVLEALLLDEGLALAWVPPEPIVRRLFDAGSPAERRQIIGRRWKSIGAACVAELDQVDEPRLAGHVRFAQKAATSLLAGAPEPSQALSANLLDSILRAEFDESSRVEITGQKVRLDIEEYPLRVAIVLAGIWGSHGQFHSSNGDAIPRRYTRHGSAHGVSGRQYSRVNAVIALMHVVALLRLLDTDLRR